MVYSREWLPKTIPVAKFNELYDKNTSLKLFIRCLYLENLMNHISDGEKKSSDEWKTSASISP